MVSPFKCYHYSLIIFPCLPVDTCSCTSHSFTQPSMRRIVSFICTTSISSFQSVIFTVLPVSSSPMRSQTMEDLPIGRTISRGSFFSIILITISSNVSFATRSFISIFFSSPIFFPFLPLSAKKTTSKTCFGGGS